jgi:hypothetical protein
VSRSLNFALNIEEAKALLMYADAGIAVTTDHPPVRDALVSRLAQFARVVSGEASIKRVVAVALVAASRLEGDDTIRLLWDCSEADVQLVIFDATGGDLSTAALAGADAFVGTRQAVGAYIGRRYPNRLVLEIGDDFKIEAGAIAARLAEERLKR